MTSVCLFLCIKRCYKVIGDITAPLIQMLLKSTGELPSGEHLPSPLGIQGCYTNQFISKACTTQNTQPNIPQIDMKVRICRVEITVTGSFCWFYIGIVSALTQERNSFSSFLEKNLGKGAGLVTEKNIIVSCPSIGR